MLQKHQYQDYLNKKNDDEPTLTVIPPSLPPRPITPNRHPPMPFKSRKGSYDITGTPKTLASPSDHKEEETSIIRELNGLSRFN